MIKWSVTYQYTEGNRKRRGKTVMWAASADAAVQQVISALYPLPPSVAATMQAQPLRPTIDRLARDNEISGGLFFSRGSMEFFGDSRSNLAVSLHPVELVTDHLGTTIQCWEVTRKKDTRRGFKAGKKWYFDVMTGKQYHGEVKGEQK